MLEEGTVSNLMLQKKEFISVDGICPSGWRSHFYFFSSDLPLPNVVLSKCLVRKSHVGPCNALCVLFSFLRHGLTHSDSFLPPSVPITTRGGLWCSLWKPGIGRGYCLLLKTKHFGIKSCYLLIIRIVTISL